MQIAGFGAMPDGCIGDQAGGSCAQVSANRLLSATSSGQPGPPDPAIGLGPAGAPPELFPGMPRTRPGLSKFG